MAMATAAAALMLAACGVLPSSDPDASTAQLVARFAPCGAALASSQGEPVGAIESVYEWVRVVEVIEAERGGAGHHPATVRDDAGAVRPAYVWRDTWPAVEWALASDAEAWFGMAEPGVMISDDFVLVTLIVTRTGAAFFAGSCFDHLLRDQVSEALGDRLDAAFAALPHVKSADVRAHLGVAIPEPPKIDEVILTERYVKRRGLESLRLIAYEATVSDASLVDDAPSGGQAPPVVCTRIAAGWNECFMVDERTRSDGATMTAYVDADGVLEFWLMNYDGDVDHPFGKLGEVRIDGRRTDVHIDTSGIAPDGTFEGSDRVTPAE